MGSETYHEPLELLSEETKNFHRIITSLVEELEAVDWYRQRAEATSDPALKAVLTHHMNEEIEHAVMNLEYIRRHSPKFDENLRTYLFTSAPITEVEAEATGGESDEGSIERRGRGATGGSGGLGIGSLRRE